MLVPNYSTLQSDNNTVAVTCIYSARYILASDVVYYVTDGMPFDRFGPWMWLAAMVSKSTVKLSTIPE